MQRLTLPVPKPLHLRKAFRANPLAIFQRIPDCGSEHGLGFFVGGRLVQQLLKREFRRNIAGRTTA